jgi:hypothetical protein
MHPTFSAALTGFVETTDRSTAEKNHLLPPNPYSDTEFDFLRAIFQGLSTEMRWQEAPDVQTWVDASRLNVLKDMEATADPERLRELQTRFLTAVFPAMERLQALGATASAAEKALIFDPAAA